MIVSGHVDVVPFADQPGWTRDALELQPVGSRLFGRGTSDMKGFLAQSVVAAEALDPGRLRRPLVLLFTAEEEIGCRGAGQLVPTLEQRLGEIPLPRLAWIGEPTSGRVFHTHKGVVAFQVEVRGKGGHSSVPERGVNAIAVAARAVLEVGALQAELRSRPDPRFGALYPGAPYTTLNIGGIAGGTAANMIAERCCFGVSYRPLPDEDPLALYREICERLGSLALHDFGSDGRGELAVGEPTVAPGLLARRGTPLESALREQMGDSQEGGAPFCTDGGQLQTLGIHSMVCGPGDLDQAHQPDESISLAALERGVADVLRVVEQLCGSGVPR